MKKMTDKKFEEWPFQVPNFDNVCARLKGFAELFEKAPTKEEALKLWKKYTRLLENVEDKITHVSVLFSLETTNKKYEKAMKKINPALETTHEPFRDYPVFDRNLGVDYCGTWFYTAPDAGHAFMAIQAPLASIIS